MASQHNGNGRYPGTSGARPAPQQLARRRARITPRMLQPRRGGKARTILFALLALAIIVALVPTIGAAAGGVYYAQTASELKPRLDKLDDYEPFQTSRIFDRNGRLLYEFVSNGRRDPVRLDQVSDDLISATIAIEDKNFWTNEGVDYVGIARALYLNFSSGEIRSGASTITQQLIKNVILTEDELQEGYERKIKEAILAQQLTDEYSKEQILELYLNEINYGNLAYGIQAAARTYFGVDARDLDLNQSSLMAGIPQLPTLYNPIRFVDANRVLKGVRVRSDWVDNYQTTLPENTPPPRAPGGCAASDGAERHGDGARRPRRAGAGSSVRRSAGEPACAAFRVPCAGSAGAGP